MKGFKVLLRMTQLGDKDALRIMTELYRGLIAREAVVDHVFDEDLMQILYDTLLRCIQQFVI